MRTFFLFLVTIYSFVVASAKDITSLPVVAYPVQNYDAQKPLVIYISGDGGENSFSKSLMQQINAKGIPAVLFNSQKYFWSKKTPQQTAADVESVIEYYRSQWKARKFILVGYSFGADVAPFIVNRLSKVPFTSLNNIVLISPSNTTDFEVHVADLFGEHKKSASNIPAEINRITQKPLLIIQGEDESEKIDARSLKVNYKLVTLKGGHRYNSNTVELANTILKNL